MLPLQQNKYVLLLPLLSVTPKASGYCQKKLLFESLPSIQQICGNFYVHVMRPTPTPPPLPSLFSATSRNKENVLPVFLTFTKPTAKHRLKPFFRWPGSQESCSWGPKGKIFASIFVRWIRLASHLSPLWSSNRIRGGSKIFCLHELYVGIFVCCGRSSEL